ncbi:MAG: LytTR family DNA-binding domain-containing protein [Myxococcota bacterium]
MTEPCKVLIADDEAPSRLLLSEYVSRHPGLSVHQVVTNGEEAVDTIEQASPDIALLDVEMPGLDGFGVLAELERRNLAAPMIVFVTAYERYAVRAFEIHAVDYLLKPVSYDRFVVAVDRCLTNAESPKKVKALLEDALYWPPQRLLVRDRGRITPIPIDEVDWLEASGDYVIVHVGTESHLLERSLVEMTELMARSGFARVHRSATVNVARIKELRTLGSGRYELVLNDGQTLTVSRSYSHQFRSQLL